MPEKNDKKIGNIPDTLQTEPISAIQEATNFTDLISGVRTCVESLPLARAFHIEEKLRERYSRLEEILISEGGQQNHTENQYIGKLEELAQNAVTVNDIRVLDLCTRVTRYKQEPNSMWEQINVHIDEDRLAPDAVTQIGHVHAFWRISSREYAVIGGQQHEEQSLSLREVLERFQPTTINDLHYLANIIDLQLPLCYFLDISEPDNCEDFIPQTEEMPIDADQTLITTINRSYAAFREKMRNLAINHKGAIADDLTALNKAVNGACQHLAEINTSERIDPDIQALSLPPFSRLPLPLVQEIYLLLEIHPTLAEIFLDNVASTNNLHEGTNSWAREQKMLLRRDN
jgi:hypothetical protein